jgi:hypothetical protein
MHPSAWLSFKEKIIRTGRMVSLNLIVFKQKKNNIYHNGAGTVSLNLGAPRVESKAQKPPRPITIHYNHSVPKKNKR